MMDAQRSGNALHGPPTDAKMGRDPLAVLGLQRREGHVGYQCHPDTLDVCFLTRTERDLLDHWLDAKLACYPHTTASYQDVAVLVLYRRKLLVPTHLLQHNAKVRVVRNLAANARREVSITDPSHILNRCSDCGLARRRWCWPASCGLDDSDAAQRSSPSREWPASSGDGGCRR